MAIKTETFVPGLVRTFSDAGMLIRRDGVEYVEAVDPVDSGRAYLETRTPIPEPTP